MPTFAPARIPLNWPNQPYSQSQKIGNIDWHYQSSIHPDPSVPSLLLIHGTGSSTHTWAPIFLELLKKYHVIALDLPGHGFTRGALKPQMHIQQMAIEIESLLRKIEHPIPNVLVGHSAGANCALELTKLLPKNTLSVIGFNPSFVSPPSAYNYFLGPLIHPIATSTFLAEILANTLPLTSMIDKLLDSTNSLLSEKQRGWYRLLFKDPSHINGAMNFMAASQIPELLESCSSIDNEMTYVVAKNDPWVLPSALLPILEKYFPKANRIDVVGGHLFHETHPEKALEFIVKVANNRQSQGN